MSLDLLSKAQRLQAIAQAGKTYCNNPLEMERWDELRDISHELLAHAMNVELKTVDDVFAMEKGYPTPKVDVRAVVFNGDKILMVKELTDGLWSLPGGWADVGYTPREIAIKEAKEEAGIDVEAQRLIAVMDRSRHPHPVSPLYVYKLFILCHQTGGQLQAGAETLDAGWFALDALPPLSTLRITECQIQRLFEYRDKPELLPHLD